MFFGEAVKALTGGAKVGVLVGVLIFKTCDEGCEGGELAFQRLEFFTLLAGGVVEGGGFFFVDGEVGFEQQQFLRGAGRAVLHHRGTELQVVQLLRGGVGLIGEFAAELGTEGGEFGVGGLEFGAGGIELVSGKGEDEGLA